MSTVAWDHAAAAPRARMTRTDAGSFADNGIYGPNNDYVLHMLVSLADGPHVPEAIVFSGDLWPAVEEFINAKRAGTARLFTGTHLMLHRHLPPGECRFYAKMGDAKDLEAWVGRITGWTLP